MDFVINDDNAGAKLELEPVVISDLKSNNPTLTSVGVKSNVDGDRILGLDSSESSGATDSIPVVTSNYPTVRLGNDISGYY